jgi:phosphotransferase system IIA component
LTRHLAKSKQGNRLFAIDLAKIGRASYSCDVIVVTQELKKAQTKSSKTV